jgi:hypothetical protein
MRLRSLHPGTFRPYRITELQICRKKGGGRGVMHFGYGPGTYPADWTARDELLERRRIMGLLCAFALKFCASVHPGQETALRKEGKRAAKGPGKHASRVKQAAEKGGMAGEFPEEAPPGLKPRVDSAGFMRGLKPPPPSVSSFSAGCKARLSFQLVAARLKPCPCYKTGVFPQAAKTH